MAQKPMRKVKILVVDDELQIRSMFEKFLTLKDFEVKTAANVLEALRVQKYNPSDLIITDYNMPEMNGIDLLKELQTTAPSIPVIMMSGGADMRIAVEALREQAFDFISKPVDLDELVHTIELALKRRVVAVMPEATSQNSVVGPIRFSQPENQRDVAILYFLRPLDQMAQAAYEVAFNRLDTEGRLTRKIIVNLSNVNYINNVGLNFLLDTFKKWQAQDKQVIFAELSETVHRYLKTLGYLDFFHVVSGVPEAVRLFI